jgi:hypothetical protein
MIGLDPMVLGSGTSLVITPTVEMLLTMAPVTFDAGYIVALDGPAGCGKTTALTALVTQTDLPVSSVSLDPRSSDKDVIRQLHSAVIGVPVPKNALRTELLGDLRERLAARPRLIIVDEAQNAGITALEMIRTLHMDPTSDWQLVISGAELDKRLTSEKMLKSRVMHWSRFSPLQQKELIPVLNGIHPLFQRFDPDLLLVADHSSCHGVLREWVKVLTTMHQLESRKVPVGRTMLEQALTATSGRVVKLPR